MGVGHRVSENGPIFRRLVPSIIRFQRPMRVRFFLKMKTSAFGRERVRAAAGVGCRGATLRKGGEAPVARKAEPERLLLEAAFVFC